jgi:hypothetical protein
VFIVIYQRFLWCRFPIHSSCFFVHQIQLSCCRILLPRRSNSFQVSSGVDGCHCSVRGLIVQHADTDAMDSSTRTSPNTGVRRSAGRHIHHQGNGCIHRFGAPANHYGYGVPLQKTMCAVTVVMFTYPEAGHFGTGVSVQQLRTVLATLSLPSFSSCKRA